jgi:hypothetical protein
VVTYVVRDQVDALNILGALDDIALDAAEAPNVRFAGWPRITVTVPEGIGARSERTITALEKIVRTQFCLVKYGTPDLRKLTAQDKVSIELGVEYSRTRMVLDFSRPATALARAVHARVAADGGRTLYQQGHLACQPATRVMPRRTDQSAAATPKRIGQAQQCVSDWLLSTR